MMPYIIILKVRKFHQCTINRFGTAGENLYRGPSLNRVKCQKQNNYGKYEHFQNNYGKYEHFQNNYGKYEHFQSSSISNFAPLNVILLFVQMNELLKMLNVHRHTEKKSHLWLSPIFPASHSPLATDNGKPCSIEF